MSAWSQRLIAVVTAGCVVLSGCTPAPVGSPTPSPSPVTSWVGSPEEKSSTWATDLDPDSTYGLHRRKGLDPVLKPEARVLAATETSRIKKLGITNSETCLADTDAHPMCRFAITFSTLPDGLAVGAVLNAGITATTPNGLLAKVTAIEGNQVTAVQASLSDALVQGEFWIEKAFSPDQLRGEPKLAPGVKIVPRKASGLRKSVPGALPAFDQLTLPGKLSIDSEPVSGVHLTGTLDFGAGCGIDGGVGGSDIAWIELGCQAWETASLAVESTRQGAVSNQRYPVGYFPLAAFPIPIGPLVIVVVVDILVTVDLSGQVHVGLQYQGSEHAEVSGGLKFSIGHGLDHTGGVKTTANGHGAGLAQDVTVTALGRAELRLSAYGVLGFGVGGDASLTVTGGPKQSPRWRILGNAGIFARVFLGILGFELTASISYHLKHDFEIASGGNANPKLTVGWPAEGEVIGVGGLLPRKVEATAVDPEDGALPVRWTDLTDNVTVEGTGPQTLPFAKLGKHVLRVSAVDSEGASVEQVIGVMVKSPALALTLRLLRADGSGFSGAPAGPAGGTLLVDAVVKSGMLTPPSCSGLDWGATNAAVQGDGSCRARVTLGQPGTAVVTATLTDQYGTSAAATATAGVTPAPATTEPEFLGIDATAGGRHLKPGDLLLGAEPVQLSVVYLNRDQADVVPGYTWTYTVAGKAPVPMPGGRELLTSTRTYTPPSPWGHEAGFKVVIRDAATKAVLTTRTFAVTWQSTPK